MRGHFLKRAVSALVGTAVTVSAAASVPATADSDTLTSAYKVVTELETSGLDVDYARALQYSMYFYDANMCGDEVEENTRLSWRGDCHAYDAKIPLQPMADNVGTNLSQSFIDKYKDVLDPDGDGTVDVAGGYHDAGDHVEFGMPENYAIATLGWGYYEFPESYKNTGQKEHIQTLLRYGNDYLMKCTFLDEKGDVVAHCYQVGDGDIDHAYWQSPETDSMARPAFFLTADKPQTDYVVSACASLAINYLNFKNDDPDYAAKSLKYAKALWKFANENDKELSDNGDGPKQYYGSSKWEDDWCWAAAWMYLATGDASCFDYACGIFDYYAPSGWAYCWNDMWSGAATMWAVINQEHPELDLVQKIRDAQGKNQYVFDNFWDNDCVGKCLTTYKQLETAGGYAFLNQWGSARYNTAMQLICLVHDKYTNNGKPGEWAEWAKSQMTYLMGDNPMDRCYICGYNEKTYQYPHHRAASGLLTAEDTRPQRHVLWGALAGGPDGSDKHIDVTSDYIYNEVTIDYNAAFVGACAGLYEMFGTADMAPTKNFPPAETGGGDDDNPGGSGYWVEAVGVDDFQATTAAGITKVSFKVMTGATKPSDKISVRYFINSSEIANVDACKPNQLYDQAKTEDGADCTLSGPIKYDKLADTYYYEVAWDGYKIANSGKKYQFLFGMYYGDTWDPTNDWSYQTLKIGTDDDFFGNGNEVLNEHICVYDDGVLVGGIEPDGSTPEDVTPKVTTTAVTTTAKTTTTTTTVTDTPKVTTTAVTTTAKTTTTTTAVTDTPKVTTTAVTKTTDTKGSDNDPDPVTVDFIYGDVDLNGEVSVVDIIVLNKYVTGAAGLNPTQQLAADCDSNNEINGLDTNVILQFLINKVSSLPINKA